MIDIGRLLDAVDLVALAEQAGAQFRKMGKDMRSACPLHGGDNRTAFSVYSDDGRQYWRCWTGCNAGGDALNFVRRWKSLDFKEAVRWLADYAHIPLTDLGLTPEVMRERQAEEKRFDVLELAAQFYRAQFEACPRAQAYAHGRGFTDELIAAAGFGFSTGQGLLAWLKEHHGDLDLARELGLIRRKDGLDFTANANGQAASPAGWLVYVHRANGRVVSFSARAIEPAEPKDKARNLPGERHLYRAEVPDDPGVLLVEGQADAESLRQLGFTAWALCGKALDNEDIPIIQRHRPMYLALDSDAAGQERVETVATQLGPLVMIVPTLPDGQHDFNDWLRAGATRERVLGLLREAKPWIDLALKRSRGCEAFELEERIQQVAVLISALPDALQARYLRAAEKTFDVPARYLRTVTETAASEHAPRSMAEVRGGRLFFRGEQLGNFSATITHELMVDDGQNRPTVRYTLAGRLAEGEVLDRVEVDAEDFDSMKWLSSWGARVMVDVPPGKLWMLRRAMQELSLPEMRRERMYNFSGWTTINGRHVFLTASGAITPDGFDPTVRVDLGNSNLRYYRLPEPGTNAREAMQASLAFLNLAPYRVSLPLWSAMYAAPLTCFYPLNAAIWVYGTTQSRKSTYTHLGLTHFGPLFVKGREFRAACDWMSTLTSLEGAMFVAKDLPLVIDDFRPQSAAGDAKAMRFKADQVVRSVGNRSARGRANADLSERLLRPPRGLVIATSELPLSDQSTVGRTIVVPVEKGDILVSLNGEGPLDKAQQMAGDGGPGLYAQAMSSYIRWLASHWDRLQEMLAGDYEAANQYARGVFPSSQSRLMDYYAVLITSARMALRFAVAAGAIEREESQRLVSEVFPAALVELLADQSKRVAGQSPVLRLCQALDDLLAQQKIYLAPKSGTAVAPPIGATLVGWYGNEKGQQRLYLLTNACLQQAKDYWARTGENFDILPDALRRELWQAGVVVRKNEEQYESLVRIRDLGATPKRLLIVSVEKLRAVASVSLWPESAGASDDEE